MLGYFTTDGRGASDLLLAEAARRLGAEGFRLAGAVQVNAERAGEDKCDMDLLVLGQGDAVRISQRLGRGARGCRLDSDGLERAVGLVEAGLAAGIDLLVVNKFGKQEAEGRGFRPVVGRAMAEGVPVLTALNRSNRAAFLEFAEGLAEELAPDVEALTAWGRSVVKAARGRAAGA